MSQLAAELRMGDPSAVADRTVQERRLRPRNGIWMAAAAVPTFVGAVVLAALAPIGILSLMPSSWESDVAFTNGVVNVGLWWLRTAPWLFAGALLCWWGTRIQARRNWIVAAFVQLALLAATFAVSVTAKTETTQGSMALGFTLPPSLPLVQLPGVALVIAFAVIAWRKSAPTMRPV